MKAITPNFVKAFLLASAVAAATSAHAAPITYYWDSDGVATGGSSGNTAAGTWGVSNFFNTISSGGGSGTFVTSLTSEDTATFSASTDVTGIYTVTVSGTQAASGIVFEEGSVTLSTGTLNLGGATGTNGISMTGSGANEISATVALQTSQSWSQTGSGTFLISGNINNGANLLTITGTGLTTISGVLGNGSGGLTKTGAGTLVLSNSNTYQGATNINGGSIKISSAANLGDSSATNTIGFNGGTLISTGGAYSLGINRVITLNGAGTIQTDAGTLTVNGNVVNGANLLTITGSGDTVISGVIGSGTGGITKNGSGTLTLSGNNTYTGVTTINTGTVLLTHVNALGSSTGATTIVSGATLDLNGLAISAEVINSNGAGIGSNGALINSNTATAASLGARLNLQSSTTIGGAGDITLSGGIGDSGATTFTKTGAGTVTIPVAVSGRSNGSALTVLNAGTVRILSASALSSATADITINSATLELSNSISLNQPLRMNNGSTFRSDGSNTSINDFQVATAVGANSVTISTVNASDVFTIGNGSNDITGGNGSDDVLHIAGPGAVSLAFNSNYIGNWSIDSGTLVLTSSANAIGNTNTATLTLAGGNLKLNYSAAQSFTGGSGNNVTVSANSTITSDRTVLTANGLTYTFGALSINSSTLDIAGGANINGGSNPAGVTFAATTLTGSPTFNVTNPVNGGTTLLTLGAINDGGIARTITKSGNGNMTLATAAASLVNGTAINITGGTLNSNLAGAIGALAAVSVSSGATFNLGASQTIGSLAGAGNVTLNAFDLTVGNTNNLSAAYSGNMTGAGNIIKAGTGTQTFSGNYGYTGNTTVNLGALRANGTHSSAGNYTVTTTGASNAILGGSGTISLAATKTLSLTGTSGTVKSIVDPGSASATIGTLIVGNAANTAGNINTTTFNNFSRLNIDLNATASDWLEIKGNFVLNTGAELFFNQLATPNAAIYKLLTYTGAKTGTAGTFTVTNLPAGYVVQYNPGEIDLVQTLTSATYTLSSSATSLNVLKGGKTSVSAVITNTGSGDTLDFTGLTAASGANGSIAGAGTNGGPLANAGGASTNSALTFTGAAYGNAVVTPGITTATNHVLGSNAVLSGSPATTTINVGNATASTGAANHDHLTVGTALSAAVTAGADAYAGLASREINSAFTEAIIKDGNAASNTTVTMAWRERNLDEAPLTFTSPPIQQVAYLISDVVEITGTGSDVYILQMSYNWLPVEHNGMTETQAINEELIRLMWLDPSTGGVYDDGTGTPNDQWRFASETVGGFFNYMGDHTPVLADGLGAFGVDTSGSTHYAWAIINKGGQFAVVPEPASLGVLAIGASSLLLRRRPRKN